MPATFSELIRQKEELLMRLVPISVRQLEIVRRSDMTALLQFLGQKTRLMDEFEMLQRQLAPYQDIPPEKRKWKDETERLETAAAINRCAAMLEEILRNDKMSTDETAEQKDEVETQLKQLRQSSQVFSSYAKQAIAGNTTHFQTES